MANAHDWLNEHGDYLYRFALVTRRMAVHKIVQQSKFAQQQTL